MKTHPKRILHFFLFALPLTLPGFLWAQAPAGAVHSIDAEEFTVKVLKRSSSGKVLLFEDPTLNDPRPGKVLLLKRGDEDLAAIRVLKNYPGRFAAKVLLKFKDIPDDGSELRSLKKLSTKVLRQIQDQERAPLDSTLTDDELAKEIAPNDIELDRGIPTPQKKKPAIKATPVPKKDEETETLEVSEDALTDDGDFSRTEDVSFERQNHILSLQLGLITNVDASNVKARYSGIGLRYGWNIARRLLFTQPNRQDMLTLEAGAYYYSITGFETADDSVTVYPLEGVIRYSFLPNDSIQFFIYLGAVKSFVQASETVTLAGSALLSRTRLALGGGLIVPIGPGWALRGDVGLEKMVFGISLRF